MIVQDLVNLAGESLFQNRSRSLLTILGIVIGIAAVILMLSIGQGAQGLIINQISALGSDQIFISSGANQENGPPNAFTEQVLKLKDAEELRKQGPFSFVSSELLSSATVASANASQITQVAGVDEFQLNVFAATVVQGRFIDNPDVANYAKVAVLGSQAALDLFGDNSPLNKKIKVKNSTLRIIGVLDKQGSRFFQNVDGYIYIPVTTAERDVLGVDYLSYIAARAEGDITIAEEEARYILRDTHHINNPSGDTANDDFTVSTQADAVKTIGIVGTALTMLLASIAAISLLVGGIGIMNIMLVSVTERTKEIGLRKAIGATEPEIMRQFLLEAVMLTFMGGIIGIVIGISAAALSSLLIAHFVDGWILVIPPSAIVLSGLVSTAVGLIFGYYPAKHAAKLDPIEALRYE